MSEDLTKIQELLNAKDLLNEYITDTPYDFIRNVSFEGDKQRYIKNLIRDIDEEVDLRFYFEPKEGPKVLLFAEKLKWDSDFFGFGIARLNCVIPLVDNSKDFTHDLDYSAALLSLFQKAKDKGIKYLWVAVNTKDLQLLRAINKTDFSLIETRAYYHMRLKDFQVEKRFSVRAANETDIPNLKRVAREMVNPYDRFQADLYLDRQDVDRLMEKWVEASIAEGFADITIVPDVPNPAAFCTVKYHKDKWPDWKLNLAQPVFSAVSSEAKGWYYKIISEINCHLIDIGVQHSYLATQVTNNQVIHVWEKLGYRYGKAEHIFRIIL